MPYGWEGNPYRSGVLRRTAHASCMHRLNSFIDQCMAQGLRKGDVPTLMEYDTRYVTTVVDCNGETLGECVRSSLVLNLYLDPSLVSDISLSL